jgi:iron complex transport system permease protein
LLGFSGALLATLGLYWLVRLQGEFDRHRLLLTGIMLAAGFGALISLLLSLSSNSDLRGMLFWLMGDLNHYQIAWWALALLVIATTYLSYLAPRLNLLLLGELQAQSMGVNVRQLQAQLYFLTALLTAVAVDLVGTIGFIGLIVPHLLRLLHSANHKLIIPGSMLLGSSFLLLANLLMQTIFIRFSVPVGVVISMVGVPLFIYLLFCSRPS